MNPLKCPGVGRDKDCISALQFYFNRRVTDDEMRFLHDVMQRGTACMPAMMAKAPAHLRESDEQRVTDDQKTP